MGIWKSFKDFWKEDSSEDNYEYDNESYDYEDKDKWIDIGITVMVPYTELVNIKKFLREYANELGWEVSSGTHISEEITLKKEKIKRVNVTISPKDNKISPGEFLKESEKIQGLNFALFRDLLYEGNHKKAAKNFKGYLQITYSKMLGKELKKSDFMINTSIGFLSYNYRLIDRVRFEKKDRERAIELFGKTAEEDLKGIFEGEGKEKLELSEKELKELKESDDFKEFDEISKKELGFDDDFFKISEKERKRLEELQKKEKPIDLKKAIEEQFGFDLSSKKKKPKK